MRSYFMKILSLEGNEESFLITFDELPPGKTLDDIVDAIFPYLALRPNCKNGLRVLKTNTLEIKKPSDELFIDALAIPDNFSSFLFRVLYGLLVLNYISRDEHHKVKKLIDAMTERFVSDEKVELKNPAETKTAPAEPKETLDVDDNETDEVEECFNNEGTYQLTSIDLLHEQAQELLIHVPHFLLLKIQSLKEELRLFLPKIEPSCKTEYVVEGPRLIPVRKYITPLTRLYYPPERIQELEVNIPHEIKELEKILENFKRHIRSVAMHQRMSEEELAFLNNVAERFKFTSENEQSPLRVMIQTFIHTAKRVIAEKQKLSRIEGSFEKLERKALPVEVKTFHYVSGSPMRRPSYCIVEGKVYENKEELGRGISAKVVLVEDAEGNQAAVKIELPKEDGRFSSGKSFYDEARFNHIKRGLGYFSGSVGDRTNPHAVFMKVLKGCNAEKIEQTSSINVIKLIRAVFVDLIDNNKKFLCHGDLHEGNVLVLTNATGDQYQLDEDNNFTAESIDFGYTFELGDVMTIDYNESAKDYLQIPPELMRPYDPSDENDLREKLVTAKQDSYGAGNLLGRLLNDYEILFEKRIFKALRKIEKELRDEDPNNRISLLDALTAIKKIDDMNCQILRKEYVRLIKTKDQLQDGFAEKMQMWLALNSHPLFSSNREDFTSRELVEMEEYLHRFSKMSNPNKIKLFLNAMQFKTFLAILTNLIPQNRTLLLSFLGLAALWEMKPLATEILSLVLMIPPRDYKIFFEKIVDRSLFYWMLPAGSFSQIFNSISNRDEDKAFFLASFVERLYREKKSETRNFIKNNYENLGPTYRYMLNLLDTCTGAVKITSFHQPHQINVILNVRKQIDRSDQNLVSVDIGFKPRFGS